MNKSSIIAGLGVAVVAYLWSTFSNMTEVNEIGNVQVFWTNLTRIVNRSSIFQNKYDLLTSLPTGDESWRNYRKVEVQLLKWHYEMYSIQTSLSNDMDTAHTKLLTNALAREKYNDKNKYMKNRNLKARYTDEDDDDDDTYDRHKKNKKYVRYGGDHKKDRQYKQRYKYDEDNTGVYNNVDEFKMHEPTTRLSNGILKWLTHILTIYTVICVITSVSQNQMLIILTLLLTLILMPLVFKGKEVNDNLTDAILNLRLRQVQLAGVFPSSSKAEMIGQHLILQKIDVIADYWETQTLGLKFKIPFIEYEISLEDEVLGGMIIANMLKLLEIFVFTAKETTVISTTQQKK
jgi:hypothetical protein